MKRMVLTLFCVFCMLPAAFALEAPQKTPVLMVHGYFLPGAETWLVLKNRIIQAGWPKDYVMNPTFKNVVGCNPEHGREIARWVEELKARTGAKKVDIVAHSMGALDVRYYIKYMCGYKNVKKVVTIAGANHGTTVACVDQLSCGAAEMCRSADDWQHNRFLKALNACDETPGDILYTSIWSAYDEIIRPPESSILQGAENIQIQTKPVGHGGILAVAETGDLVIYALKQGGRNYDGPGWECLKCDEPDGEGVDASEVSDMADTTAEVNGADMQDLDAESPLDVQAWDIVRDLESDPDILTGQDAPKADAAPVAETQVTGGEKIEQDIHAETRIQDTRIGGDDTTGATTSPSGGCTQGSGPAQGVVLLFLLTLILLRRRGY